MQNYETKTARSPNSILSMTKNMHSRTWRTENCKLCLSQAAVIVLSCYIAMHYIL